MPVEASEADELTLGGQSFNQRVQTFGKIVGGSTEAALAETLASATGNNGWQQAKGRSEKLLFDKDFQRIKENAYRRTGLVDIVELYEEAKPLIEALVLELTRPDRADADYLGREADGANQALIRQIGTGSFRANDISLSEFIEATDAGVGGNQDIIPRSGATNTEAQLEDGSADAALAVILYYQNSLNPGAFEQITEHQNDDIGERNATNMYFQSIGSDLGIHVRENAMVLLDSTNIDINATVVKNDVDHDLMPQGVEVVIANQVESLGTSV